MNYISTVILAGGSGTRLWPLSREVLPKQFLSLVGDHTLFQQTVLRAKIIAPAVEPLIVCQSEHYFHCEDQLADLAMGTVHYILEPVARDTAGAIALAALYLSAQGRAEIPMLIMPSDHLLENTVHFKQRIEDALAVVPQNALVTFGIEPKHPETGYGYIERGNIQDRNIYSVKRFVEKPDRETAEHYLASGEYFWNSGMFLFSPHAYLTALKTLEPAVFAAAQSAFEQAKSHERYCRINQEAYAVCPKISIDYAVLEKSPQVFLAPLDTTWSDLGCWASVAKNQTTDENHNVVLGDVFTKSSHHCYFNAQDNRLIAAIGIENQIVVSTTDAVLVADKKYAQDVKAIVAQLKEKNHESVMTHKRVYRPWGYYESLAMGLGYQVKHIMVKPGARLSLQMHHHRAEHWVVVRGEAEVVNGENTLILKENQSTYIPQTHQHRLSNLGKEPLHVIEVQSGSYLGEDDIVRFQDDYARDAK